MCTDQRAETWSSRDAEEVGAANRAYEILRFIVAAISLAGVETATSGLTAWIPSSSLVGQLSPEPLPFLVAAGVVEAARGIWLHFGSKTLLG